MWLFQSKAVGGLPQDRLQPKDLTPLAECLQAQSGLPATADACAYDPIQRLLAVSVLSLHKPWEGFRHRVGLTAAAARPAAGVYIRWAGQGHWQGWRGAHPVCPPQCCPAAYQAAHVPVQPRCHHPPGRSEHLRTKRIPLLQLPAAATVVHVQQYACSRAGWGVAGGHQHHAPGTTRNCSMLAEQLLFPFYSTCSPSADQAC
jgi:hypothetical protein